MFHNPAVEGPDEGKNPIYRIDAPHDRAFPSRLVRSKSAAQYIAVSPWKLRELVRRGIIPSAMSLVVRGDLTSPTSTPTSQERSAFSDARFSPVVTDYWQSLKDLTIDLVKWMLEPVHWWHFCQRVRATVGLEEAKVYLAIGSCSGADQKAGEKDLTEAASSSVMSKTVYSFVISNRSCIFLVRWSSFNSPPCYARL